MKHQKLLQFSNLLTPAALHIYALCPLNANSVWNTGNLKGNWKTPCRMGEVEKSRFQNLGMEVKGSKLLWEGKEGPGVEGNA